MLPGVWGGKSLQEYPIINAYVCWYFILGYMLFPLYINDIHDDAICIMMLMVLFRVTYLKFTYFKSPSK